MQAGNLMADNENASTLADNLETAVASEEVEQINTAVKAITDQKAEQAVVGKLGERLTQRGINTKRQTVLVYALNALNHVEVVHNLGKFLLNPKNDIALRTTTLGLLQNQIQTYPTVTLTYLRQALDRAEPAFGDRIQSSFEFAISETVDQGTSARQILIDAGVKPTHLRASLFKKVENLDGATIPIPSIFAEALGILGGQDAIDLLCQLLHTQQVEQLHDEQNAQSAGSEPSPTQLNKEQIRERIMLAAVNALRVIESQNVILCLADTLANNVNYKVQRQAADALGKLGFSACIPPLLSALFKESNDSLKKKIGSSLNEIKGWREKTTQLVTHLTQNPIQRDQIDAGIILLAVQPEQDELAADPHLLTNFFIDAAVQQINDERMLQIYAELIKKSTNNNTTVINEKLEEYRENKQVSEEILQALRVEIGGAQTLKPLLNKLEKNLLDYFQKPIDSLNSDTQRIWKQTIFLANLGFLVRILLNLAIFGIGGYFMVDSYNRIVAGTLTTQQLTALMAVFIGGGATMFATFFTFPLKQIKRAVTDVGLANVAFISYIHCVLQISHTFSYFYLNGDISFNEIKNAAKQIEETSHEAILTLNIAGSEGDQTQFDKALLDRIVGIANKQIEGARPSADTPPQQ